MTAWPYSTHDEVSHLAMDDPAILRARIDQLLEERRELRRTAGRSEDVSVPLKWGLSAQEARFFAALVMSRREVADKEYVYAEIAKGVDDGPAMQIVDVYAHKVRKKLAPYGIVIETVRGRGYRLDPEVRARFREAAGGSQ